MLIHSDPGVEFYFEKKILLLPHCATRRTILKRGGIPCARVCYFSRNNRVKYFNE